MRDHSGAIQVQLERVFNHGTVAGLDDETLLRRFVAERDEVAFAAMVARHGRMVLGVCRRVLRDERDVEDAFQATFLVLVDRAGAIRAGNLLGHWIYGVAHRVAVRARANLARRHVLERASANRSELQPAPRDGEHRELREILEDELARLPEALKSPTVLCYLEGMTHEEAAARLRWPVGTVRSRLARARARLRTRLSRRGLSADDAALTVAVASRPVSTALLNATIRSSLEFTSHHATATALCSAAALAEGVLHAMKFSNLKLLGWVALTCVLALGGMQSFVIYELRAELEARRKPDPPPIQAGRSGPQPAPVQVQAPPGAAGFGGAGGGMAGMMGGDVDNPMGSGMGGMMGIGGGSLIPTGMGGMMGSMMSSDKPRYIQSDKLIVITSPDGDTVTAYSTETGKARSIRLPQSGGSKLEIVPIVSQGLAALYLKGTQFSRIAAFSVNDGTWHAQDLREPVDKAVPLVGSTMAAYGLGRRIYAFSSAAARWDVLELPEGTVPQPTLGVNTIIYIDKKHLHVFSAKLGTWASIDIRGESAGQDAGPAPKR